VNTVDEKDWRSASPLGESDAALAPVEPAFFTADEIGEMVDALSGKGIVRSGDAEQRTAGKKDLSPGCIAYFDLVGIVHQGL
jgi:hypothetical protein